MAKTPETYPPPASTDLDAWRIAIADGRLGDFRLEDIVAAIQDLGPGVDPAIIRALASHLSNALMGMLTSYVRPGQTSRGKLIVEDAHGHLIEAVLQPDSADGKALREAFRARVHFRAKDAMRREDRQPAIEADLTPTAAASDSESGDKESEMPLVALASDPSDWREQWVDIRHLLERLVPDKQKRLAFHLFMEGVPRKSTKGRSIAQAVGVSEKTAREWIKEVRDVLRSAPEVQELLKSRQKRVTS